MRVEDSLYLFSMFCILGRQMSACVVVSSLRAQPPKCSLSRQAIKDNKSSGTARKMFKRPQECFFLVLFVFLLVTVADLSSWAHDSEIVKERRECQRMTLPNLDCAK